MIIGKKTSWTIAILASMVGVYSLVVANIFTTTEMSPILTRLAETPVPSAMHFIGGGIAIIFGVLQFSSTLRQRYLVLHKTVGPIYFLAVICSGVAGLFLGMNVVEGGSTARSGFTLLAIFWLLTASFALMAIMRKDIALHRYWVTINFALTLAALSLRIQLPIGMALFEFDTVYAFVAWSCWVPNIIIAMHLHAKWLQAEEAKAKG